MSLSLGIDLGVSSRGSSGGGSSTSGDEDMPVQGRLTLVAGNPVPITDQVGKTSVFFTPYKGNKITLWNGSAWVATDFAETELALGAVTSGRPYDIFAYLNAGVLALEKTIWTDAVTRATGVTIQDGRYCKTGDKTRLYLGSIYTTSVAATEDSNANRLVWNYYNRVNRKLLVQEPADSWTYSTATYRQANGNAANQLGVMNGIAEEPVEISVVAGASSSVAANPIPGIGVNAVDTNSADIKQPTTSTATNDVVQAHLRSQIQGYTYYPWIEKGVGVGTQTWMGDLGTPASYQSGIFGSMNS